MIAVSGLFVPVQSLPPVLHTVVRVLPLTYAVRLLQGIWNGDGWLVHVSDVAALTVLFVSIRRYRRRYFVGSDKVFQIALILTPQFNGKECAGPWHRTLNSTGSIPWCCRQNCSPLHFDLSRTSRSSIANSRRTP